MATCRRSNWSSRSSKKEAVDEVDTLIPGDGETQSNGGAKGYQTIKVINNNSPLDKNEQLGGESVGDATVKECSEVKQIAKENQTE